MSLNNKEDKINNHVTLSLQDPTRTRRSVPAPSSTFDEHVMAERLAEKLAEHDRLHLDAA
jgi:hypothetical protein